MDRKWRAASAQHFLLKSRLGIERVVVMVRNSRIGLAAWKQWDGNYDIFWIVKHADLFK